jgi:hypothetical protein
VYDAAKGAGKPKSPSKREAGPVVVSQIEPGPLKLARHVHSHGPTMGREAAPVFGVGRSTISMWARAAAKEGWLTIEQGKHARIRRGKVELPPAVEAGHG